MLKFKKPLLKIGRSRQDTDNLNADQLHAKALKNIRIIAVLGIVLILADLGMSLTGQSIRSPPGSGNRFPDSDECSAALPALSHQKS